MRIYNEYTFLNETPVRYINYIVMLFLIVVIPFSSSGFDFELWKIVVMGASSIVVSLILTAIIAKRIDCYNPKTIERNEDTFKHYYFILCLVFCFLLSASVFILYENDFLWIYWVPVVFFIFNIAFIPNLHFWMFEDKIMLD